MSIFILQFCGGLIKSCGFVFKGFELRSGRTSQKVVQNSSFQLKQDVFQSEKDVIYLLKTSLKFMTTKTSAFKPKKDVAPDAKSKRDNSYMENVRIVQKNLVFVSGLPGSIADADLLRSKEYFGRYGKVLKVVTNPQQPVRKPCSYQAYVTYSSITDAAIAITALDGFNFEEKPLKVSFGTTKYCAHFIRGYECLNTECFYLHGYDRKNEVLNKDTKAIFEEQNEEAMDIVYENMEEIVERIVESGEQIPDEGFPSLMEMMEFLVESKIISASQLQTLLKKHKSQKLPKLMTTVSMPAPAKVKPDSPKQTTKLTKSNSFSTVGSPSKSQTQLQPKGHGQRQKECPDRPKQQKIEVINLDSRQVLQKHQKIAKLQKKQKQQKAIKQNELTRRQQQIDAAIEKQFLKHIFKLNQKSKSRMQFAGQPEWNEIHKIKEIVQKHLIISN